MAAPTCREDVVGRPARSRARLSAAFALLLVALLPRLAGAHPFSVSYAHLAVSPKDIVVTVRLPLDDMDLLLRLDRNLDGSVSDGEIEAARPGFERYLAQHVLIRLDEREVPVRVQRIGRWVDHTGFPFAEVALTAPSGSAPSRLTFKVTALSDLYKDHRTLAEIAWGARRDQFVFQHGSVFETDAQGGSWWDTASSFLRLGVEHILTGYDHLLFLLALLLVGRGVRDLVMIVSSFTVAHTVTLVVAAFGLLTPPARVVESVIALSIAYVGIENLVATELAGRWKLTAVFGLVHGFGFANVLRDMALPREALVQGLLAFNVGVELGQIAVVLLAWPLLRWLQRSSLAVRGTRWASVGVATCGLFWFAQRVLA